MFLICTIANDLSQYAAMKASFLQAGFDEEQCRYCLFDNSTANLYDPYRVISATMAEAVEPYVIFCHQDVLLNKGHGFDQLVSQINILNERDGAWAIAGNAGCMDNLTPVTKIDDPHGSQNYGDLPQKVCTLDENFLVLKTASKIECSAALNGFHLYATDLCLHAMQQGLSCYVIDFFLTHLSRGNAQSLEFHENLRNFKEKWDKEYVLCLLQTPSMFLELSKYQVFHRPFQVKKIRNLIIRSIGFYVMIAHCKNWLVLQKRVKL